MRGRASLILVALASYAVDSSVDRGALAPRLLRGGSEMMPPVSNSSLNASAAAEVAAGGAAMGSEVMAPPFPPFAEPDVGKETRGDAIRARVPRRLVRNGPPRRDDVDDVVVFLGTSRGRSSSGAR